MQFIAVFIGEVNFAMIFFVFRISKMLSIFQVIATCSRLGRLRAIYAFSHPEEAYASSYITFSVLNRFISCEKRFDYVSLRGKVGLLVVCEFSVLRKRLG